MIHLRMSLALALLSLSLAGRTFAAAFPEPYNTDPPDHVPMPATEAAKTFKMPPGFKVSLFAAEPDVQQPIAMTFDSRGRLWVAEDYTYADAKEGFATNLNDRIVLFEDADNDGHFDKRTVFWDQGKILTSIEVGRGGVFVLCAPKLLFIPDRDGDGVPDGEPEVLLDGFDTTTGSRHTFANGLRWGPDGWLWGRVGISSTAHIGRPGTPAEQRLLMAGGIWRYNPDRHVVEVVAQGTTNPWGMDWNEVGEPFFINTVIGHLWHAIPGAHFGRMYGDDPDPHSYGLIEQHADHFHFDTGAGWTKSRAAMDGSAFASGSDSLGGGHAHAGLMIYQADNWPAQYRGGLFTLNLHGRRVNEDRLERSGSGYVGRHEPDLFSVGDPWFRGLDLIQGPDGGVFISDWSDTGECHDQDGIHRKSGRIYKVTYGEPKKPAFGDLAKLPSAQLLPLLFDRNEWLARHARQVLADRCAAGLGSLEVADLARALRERFSAEPTASGKLHALWALHVLRALPPDQLLALSGHADEHVRSWAVRLLVENPGEADEFTVTRLVELARDDPSALVRLYLASALQRLPLASRAGLADALVRHGEDAADHNLGLMLWYGIEPLVAAKPDVGLTLALASRHPVLREYIARRFTEELG
ncbi:MAG TPA: PVC-type heme-binding CxxCH protein, partial [Candidatus Limnocylindria bacterium]|nr:PVC-type heme-binding CxxCH protein [Candidatus Limnocylindria bacterium]